MDRVDKFALEMEKVDYYIYNPLSFIYEHIDDPTSSEIIECYKYIYLNNKEMIRKFREYLKGLEDKIKSVKPLVLEHNSDTKEEKIEEVTKRVEDKDLSDVIEFITYCNFDTELDIFLDTLSKDDILRIKLYFLREVKLYEEVISDTILNDYSADVSKLQSELKVYKEVLNRLIKYTKKEEVLEESKTEQSNIIILPSKKSSYLLQDIKEYSERSKEIKNAFDKIIEGYFLRTKDLKPIREAQDSLYEYRNPNGIRILYFVKGNYIFITSLFFKDKQKSTRISSYYDEAHNRYYNAYNYVMDNLNNPDFYIEQAELVGQIYSFLEANMVVSKRLGDKND